MSSWWRLPFVLVLLCALVLLFVVPVTVAPASAGFQASGIFSSSVDLGDDLDDTFDLMLVTAEAHGAPEASRPLPLAPGFAGPRRANSLDRPPDRSPPDSPVRYQLRSQSPFTPFRIPSSSLDSPYFSQTSSPAGPALLDDHSWPHLLSALAYQ